MTSQQIAAMMSTNQASLSKKTNHYKLTRLLTNKKHSNIRHPSLI